MSSLSIPSDVKTQILSQILLLRKELEETYKIANGYKQELNKIKSELTEDTDEKLCVNCHKPFNPKLNTDSSCVYHPGKIKFYFCKYTSEL